MTKLIPVFFTFNNNYVVPAIVALYSLLNKSNKNIYYKMYILHNDITGSNEKLILNSLNKFNNFELNFIKMSGFIEESWKKANWGDNYKNIKFTLETLYRCFAARMFPQFDKIIYSDVDVVFNDDISSLFEIDLNDKYIAAVKDPFLNYPAFDEINHLSDYHYKKFKNTWFAGGIWVMNLKKIREDNLEQRMIDIINDNTIEKRWFDMDVMNIACDNNVIYIPLNYICYPFLLNHIDNKQFKSSYSRDELYDSLINPKIIHYAGKKPWQDKNMSFAINWWVIFNYLKLPKTAIFIEKNEIDYFRNKYMKYKKFFKILIYFAVILVFCCAVILLSLCFN